MDDHTKDRYRALLNARLDALEAEDNANADSRDIVTLDQQSVGRLSRMDAIQQQAMANATKARRAVERRQIAAALDRIMEDEFGYCENCGDEIPKARLSLAPTAIRCVSCIG